jgi:hypothetical protein
VARVLALISLALAIAWKREHSDAACWRAAFEADDTGAAEPCA